MSDQVRFLAREGWAPPTYSGIHWYRWYSGQILNYDPVSGKYGAFPSSDGQTVYIDPLEEADDIDIAINNSIHR